LWVKICLTTACGNSEKKKKNKRSLYTSTNEPVTDNDSPQNDEVDKLQDDKLEDDKLEDDNPEEDKPEIPKVEKLIEDLQDACINGEKDEVIKLLQLAKVGQSNQNQETGFKKFKNYLTTGYSKKVLKSTDTEGHSLLHITLLAYKDALKIDSTKEPGVFVKIFNTLLDNNVSPTQKDNNGFLPIHYFGDLKDIPTGETGFDKMIIALNNKDPKSINKKVHSETALHITARKNNLPVMKSLLNNGAIITKTNDKKQTTIHVATKNNHQKAVELLINSQKDLDIFRNRDKYKQTILSISIKNKNLPMTTMILNKGEGSGHTSIQDEKGRNPLHQSIESRLQDIGIKIIEKAEILEKKKSFFSSTSNNQIPSTYTDTDKKGNTPLHYTAKFGTILIAKRLLKRHSNVDYVNQKNNQKETALDKAYYHGQKLMSELLETEYGGKRG